jgi:predicted XRE-type DNA-binding protein
MTTEVFESVWDALEGTPTEAENMKLRSSLMIAISEAVSAWQVTQMDAATPRRDAASAERPAARPCRQVQY